MSSIPDLDLRVFIAKSIENNAEKRKPKNITHASSGTARLEGGATLWARLRPDKEPWNTKNWVSRN